MDVRYSPPAHDQTTTGESAEEYIEASQGQRLANFIVDSIVVRILSTAVVFMLAKQAPNFGVLIAISLGVWYGYYAGFEMASGRTLGKLVTKTRVVRTDGAPPTTGQIIGRTFARLVPLEPFSFLTRDNWHDKWSGTCVVRDARS